MLRVDLQAVQPAGLQVFHPEEVHHAVPEAVRHVGLAAVHHAVPAGGDDEQGFYGGENDE